MLTMEILLHKFLAFGQLRRSDIQQPCGFIHWHLYVVALTVKGLHYVTPFPLLIIDWSPIY